MRQYRRQIAISEKMLIDLLKSTGKKLSDDTSFIKACFDPEGLIILTYLSGENEKINHTMSPECSHYNSETKKWTNEC